MSSPAVQYTSVTPPAYPDVFRNGIRHPELWLWDSWITRDQNTVHLFCLALNRIDTEGRATIPANFNDYPFHFRHFSSHDDGDSWTDLGPALHPKNVADRSDSHNVWSGSVYRMPSGQTLYGITGLDAPCKNRPYVQSIMLAEGGLNGPDSFPNAAQSHPVRDRTLIVAAGYYLPDAQDIGHIDGEAGGPILSWRDPFIFAGADGALRAIWSAKIGSDKPALAHARITGSPGHWGLGLCPPITLPDAHEFTQAEVPKLCRDEENGDWLLMISSCNRRHESQPDSAVNKHLRLYRSAALSAPWTPAFKHGSIIPDTDTLFGASFFDASATHGSVRILAPRWAAAGPRNQMSIAPIQTIRVTD